MSKQTLSILVVVTTVAGLVTLAPGVAKAQPAGLSNNTFPPSFYGFNPGYYGPYYPGQYQYGRVDPGIYNNHTYSRSSGYNQGYQTGYGASSTLSQPYGYPTYPSPSSGASSYGYESPWSAAGTSRYVPSTGSYSSRLPYVSALASRPAAREDTAALLEVRLPTPDAELWVEGRKTASTGTWRRFSSPPLIPGERYGYEFRARWLENGREVIRSRNVTFRAGERILVDFTTG